MIKSQLLWMKYVSKHQDLQICVIEFNKFRPLEDGISSGWKFKSINLRVNRIIAIPPCQGQHYIWLIRQTAVTARLQWRIIAYTITSTLLNKACLSVLWHMFWNSKSNNCWLVNSYSAGTDIRRQILTTKVDPRTVRVKIIIMVVDP